MNEPQIHPFGPYQTLELRTAAMHAADHLLIAIEKSNTPLHTISRFLLVAPSTRCDHEPAKRQRRRLQFSERQERDQVEPKDERFDERGERCCTCGAIRFEVQDVNEEKPWISTWRLPFALPDTGDTISKLTDGLGAESKGAYWRAVHALRAAIEAGTLWRAT